MLRYIFLFPFCLFFSLSATAQFDLDSNLSDEEKIYGLSKFWSEATYNFAFFDQTDVNWDSAYQAFIPRVLATPNTFEYYRELMKFCALLQDGHTDVYRPRDLVDNNVFIRLIFKRLNGKIIVANVSKVEAEKVPVGSQLLSVNGMPADSFFLQEVMPFISGSTEHERWNDALNRYGYPLRDTIETQTMVFLRPDGTQATYQNRYHNHNTEFFHSYDDWQRFAYEMRDDNIAVVKVNTFGDGGVVDDFAEHVPEMLQAKAVILDLRDNGGGNSDVGAAILQYFTTEELIGSTWRTREHRAAYKAWGDWLVEEQIEDFTDWSEEDLEWYQNSYEVATGNSWYVGDTMRFEPTYEGPRITAPLVVLISNNTASAAEDFLIFLDGLERRNLVIGQRSFGSTGQPMQFALPGGGSARICTKRDTYPDGREFVGYGIEPDIFIEPTIQDLIDGLDIELEKALEMLR